MKNRFLLLLLPLILFIHSCGEKKERITLSVNSRPLIVEVARTGRERERGLMYREELQWNEGMLFVFKEDEILSFWMKDTKIPLSIAFLDKDGKVTDIFDMIPYSLTPVNSSKRCRYALEVNRGFFRESELKVGDTVDLHSVR